MAISVLGGANDYTKYFLLLYIVRIKCVKMIAFKILPLELAYRVAALKLWRQIGVLRLRIYQ